MLNLTFPYPMLTKIIRKPMNAALKLLTKEVYANAHAIPSTRGGGQHGHLGIVLLAANYLALTGHAFILLVHPNDMPNFPNPATQFQISEAVQQYNVCLLDLATAYTLWEETKKQILLAINCLYLAALEHDDFGFASGNCGNHAGTFTKHIWTAHQSSLGNQQSKHHNCMDTR